MFSFDFTNLHASGSGVLTKEPHQISYAELTGDWRLCTYRAWVEQLTLHQGWWGVWGDQINCQVMINQMLDLTKHIHGVCLSICINVPGKTGFTMHTSMYVYAHIQVYIHHIPTWAAVSVLAQLCHILLDPVMMMEPSLGSIVCFRRRVCSFLLKPCSWAQLLELYAFKWYTHMTNSAKLLFLTLLT